MKSCHYCVKTNTAKNQYEKAKKLKKATPIVADTISSALSCPSTSNCNRIFTEFDSNLEKEVFSSKFFSPLFVLRVSVQLGARGWGAWGDIACACSGNPKYGDASNPLSHLHTFDVGVAFKQ